MQASPVRPLKIGAFTCPNNLVLAPMAGIADSPFRRMCLKGGAGLVVSEMVSAQALFHGNAKTVRMIRIEQDEHPVALQIFGGTADAITDAARQAAEAGADIIDINSGCPVKKILKSGSGSALLRDEKKFAEVVAAAVKAVSKPVTVKIRTGLKAGEPLAARFARIAQDCGAAAVTVHARPAENFHNGPVDLDALAAACAAVSIPVIGNGGVSSAGTAAAMFSAGCSGVMIGRAAVGNPYIFGTIAQALSGEAVKEPSPRDKARMFAELLRMNSEVYGEEAGILRSRKVAGYWIRGFPEAARLRTKFMTLSTFKQARELLNSIC